MRGASAVRVPDPRPRPLLVHPRARAHRRPGPRGARRRGAGAGDARRRRRGRAAADLQLAARGPPDRATRSTWSSRRGRSSSEPRRPTLTATSTVALPDDTRLRWFVRAVSGGPLTDTALPARRFIRVATSPGPPTITGAPPAITRTPTPTFTWSGGRVSSRWSILNPAGTPVQTGEVPTASGPGRAGPAPGRELPVPRRAAESRGGRGAAGVVRVLDRHRRARAR